ncbi:MAG: pyrroline-5-carboxylate reductase [Comamonadaceae bacterium]|nr:MAG: pyrroline-5-carboxylate reductase [Comamonadaceae bacterium]
MTSSHDTAAPAATSTFPAIAFIGGGNMAGAILGGLRQRGVPADRFEVVEPFGGARDRLLADFGIEARVAASDALARCKAVVWAVKPQSFSEAAIPVAALTSEALHLSVAAGIPSDSIARWLGTQRVVRTMPNTPALIGQGMTGVFARPGASSPADRALTEAILSPTGRLVWVDDEAALDAVTAVSGSGPAYVFYFIEAMIEAGVEMGLSPQQARELAIGTFTGASALASEAQEPPAVLRERVTSKGGTTSAALSSMEAAGLKTHFKAAMQAARARAGELAVEFGKD